jgi:hypothetical protein
VPEPQGTQRKSAVADHELGRVFMPTAGSPGQFGCAPITVKSCAEMGESPVRCIILRPPAVPKNLYIQRITWGGFHRQIRFESAFASEAGLQH